MMFRGVPAHLHAVPILLRTTSHPSISNVASWEELDPVGHHYFQPCAVRQCLKKSDWIILVGRGLPIRGQHPLQPNCGLIIDLISDPKFTAARCAPGAVGANQDLGTPSTTANGETAYRILYL